MRVVFDTVIFVRGLINPYSWWGRLLFDYAQHYQLIVSPPLLTEYLEVMQRPELTRKYRSVATRDPHVVLDRLATAEVVQLTEIKAVCRDPEDDKFLATATAGAAEYLVSEDDDLLDLGEYEDVPVITAAAFLQLLPAQEEPGGDAQ